MHIKIKIPFITIKNIVNYVNYFSTLIMIVIRIGHGSNQRRGEWSAPKPFQNFFFMHGNKINYSIICN
jgi:hypothetical protein